MKEIQRKILTYGFVAFGIFLAAFLFVVLPFGGRRVGVVSAVTASFSVAPESLGITRVEGEAGSALPFKVTNNLPRVDADKCVRHGDDESTGDCDMPQDLSFDVSAVPDCLSISPTSFTMGSDKFESVTVTASGASSCTGGTVTVRGTRQADSLGGAVNESVDIPVFVAATPLDIPYTIWSTKGTFTVTPGLVAAGGSEGLPQPGVFSFTLKNGSQNQITVSGVTLPPGGSANVPIGITATPSSVRSQVTFSNANDPSDTVTVPITVTLMPWQQQGNRSYPTPLAYTFPPSFGSNGTILHGGGGLGQFAGGLSSPFKLFSSPADFLFGILQPGSSHSYHFESIDPFNNHAYPGGTVRFTAPPAGNAPRIVRSRWAIFERSDAGQPVGPSVLDFTCAGKCDYPAQGLRVGKYQAALSIMNNAGQFADATKNFDVVSDQPRCTSFTADPARIVIPPPFASTLSWSCRNVTACNISPGVGTVSPAAGGTTSVRPESTTTYTLSCSGPKGQTPNYTATVRVFEFSGGGIHEILPHGL